MTFLDNITGECLKQALYLVLGLGSAMAGGYVWLLKRAEDRVEKANARAERAEAKAEAAMLETRRVLERELERLRSTTASRHSPSS